jgi:antitoxin (DNA-binding transcriptional repressor) of toxin-antitoxin stability system
MVGSADQWRPWGCILLFEIDPQAQKPSPALGKGGEVAIANDGGPVTKIVFINQNRAPGFPAQQIGGVFDGVTDPFRSEIATKGKNKMIIRNVCNRERFDAEPDRVGTRGGVVITAGESVFEETGQTVAVVICLRIASKGLRIT